MKKPRLALPFFVLVLATPILIACAPQNYVQEKPKEVTLEQEFNNLEVFEKSYRQIPKKELYPSSLNEFNFEFNTSPGFQSNINIQPSDAEGKADVFVTLYDQEFNSKIKKFTFENYKSKTDLPSAKITQLQLDEMLNGIIVIPKFARITRLASEVSKDDFFVINGQQVLDNSFEFDIELLANDQTSELFITISLKKDGITSIKKEFPIIDGFKKISSTKANQLPTIPINWPQLKSKKIFLNENQIGSNIIENAKKSIENAETIFYQIFEKFFAKENKIDFLSPKLKSNFNEYSIDLKNIIIKFESIKKNYFSNSSDYKKYLDPNNVAIGQIKILLNEVNKFLAKTAKELKPAKSFEDIKKEINDLKLLTKEFKLEKETNDFFGVMKASSKLFVSLHQKNSFEKVIDNMKINCLEESCVQDEVNKDNAYNFSLLLAQIFNVALKNSLNFFASGLAIEENITREKIEKSFEKQNAKLLEVFSKNKISTKYLENVSKIKKIYKKNNSEFELENIKENFKNIILNSEIKEDWKDIEAAIIRVQKQLKPTEKSKNELKFDAIVLEWNKNLDDLKTKNIKTIQQLNELYSNINSKYKELSDANFGIFVLLINSHVTEYSINEFIIKIEKLKNDSKETQKYDILLKNLNIIKENYSKIFKSGRELFSNELESFDDFSFYLKKYDLIALINSYLTQLLLDHVPTFDSNYLDSTYLALTPKK